MSTDKIPMTLREFLDSGEKPPSPRGLWEGGADARTEQLAGHLEEAKLALFECPECGFSGVGPDGPKCCGLCAGDTGRDVLLDIGKTVSFAGAYRLFRKLPLDPGGEG